MASQPITTRASPLATPSTIVFAAIAGWILLGEALGPLQVLGGVLILAGIVCVRMERVEPKAAGSVELGGEPVPEPVVAESRRA